MYGACRHKPRFHRFDHTEHANTSTDESRRTKGSHRPSSTTSTGSTGSTNSLGSINDSREEPLLGSNDPAPSIWENYSNGLQARSLLITEESRTDQQRVGPIIGRRASKPLISTEYQLHNKLNINSNDPLPRRPVRYRSNAFAKEVLYTLKPSQLLFTPRYTR